MKKLIILCIAATTMLTAAMEASAACIPHYQQRGYCVDYCTNNFHRNINVERRGHHSRYCCENNEYCPYR